jgi:AcrR family transcriptional regulator
MIEVTDHVFVTSKVTRNMESNKRLYSSDLRDEQARQTRWRIVSAASRLFVDRGFAATTVDAIAAEAGVSRKTVFTAVGGKVALLKLAYDYAMSQDDEPLAMIERPGLREVSAEEDDYRSMELYASFVTEVSARISGVYLALRGAAEVDDEARALYDKWEQERRQAMRMGPVPRMVAHGTLREGVTADEAADVLALLVAPSTYHSLVVIRGWKPERYRDWFRDTILQTVMAPR